MPLSDQKGVFLAKQLSLPERIVIEQMIHKDYSFASIGRNLDWSASTIAREVLRYRCSTSRIPLMWENDCINRFSCQRNTLCPEVGVHGCFAAIVKWKKAARRTKLEYQYRQGRTIEDFNSFVEANPDFSIVEMDTVKGSRERGKVFLTMIFRKTSFMAKHLLI